MTFAIWEALIKTVNVNTWTSNGWIDHVDRDAIREWNKSLINLLPLSKKGGIWYWDTFEKDPIPVFASPTTYSKPDLTLVELVDLLAQKFDYKKHLTDTLEWFNNEWDTCGLNIDWNHYKSEIILNKDFGNVRIPYKNLDHRNFLVYVTIVYLATNYAR